MGAAMKHLKQNLQLRRPQTRDLSMRGNVLAFRVDGGSRHASGAPGRLGWVLGSLLLIGMLFASPAWATFEQVSRFPKEGEPIPLLERGSHITALAVNSTGAGGVENGTFYTVSETGAGGGSTAEVFSFSPKGEFLQAWGWGVGNGASEFQRCGPKGEPAYPTCSSRSGGVPGQEAGQLKRPKGIAIDQTTGDVYVLNERPEDGTGKRVIQVFSADGQIVAGFGELAVGRFNPRGEPLTPESIAESPGKLHYAIAEGIAVDDAGDVYLSDMSFRPPDEDRVMVFKPQSPGDYEHYVYAGRGNDIAASGGPVDFSPQGLAVDDAGNLYFSSESHIYKFSPGNSTAPACQYAVPGGAVESMTVNSSSGEVFFFRGAGETKIHQLHAVCNPSGKFEEAASFQTKEKFGLGPMAIDPGLSYEPSLPPGTMYTGESGGGFIFAQSEVRLPVVESESVSAVAASTAVLGAQINPKGSPTRYVFQYLDEAAYQANEPGERFLGATEAPLGGGAIGSSQGAESAGVALAGLQPDTVYHYRVIATSHCEPEHEENVCEAAGADQSFRTFPVEAPGLPDGRAYELVSPAQKNGGEVFPADPSFTTCGECKPSTFGSTYPMQSTPDGEALVYEGFPFSSNEGATIYNEYRSQRTPSGWQTTTLAPPQTGTTSASGYLAFDPQLTQGLIQQEGAGPPFASEAPVGIRNLYTQPTGSPLSLLPLLRAEPPNRLPLTFKLTYAGASTDLSRVFFKANDALTEATPSAPASVDGGEEADNLYEFSNGRLRLVNVAPGNAGTTPGAYFGSQSGLKATGFKADLSHAISADGSRAFWTSVSGQVFVREGGETTLEIPDASRFVTASADGSRVLLGDGKLFDVDDLTEAPIDLTEGKGGFEGIIGQSEDLSSIYFVDTAVLNEGENDQGAKARAGESNLYGWHEGVSTFVATLASGTGSDNSNGVSTGDWQDSPSLRTAEASPDGRWVAFLSRAPLTGYDNNGPCGSASGKTPAVMAPCFEAFLYDSASETLVCASCNPTGEQPLGSSNLRVIRTAPESLPQPRYLTDSGRLYFDSRDSLSQFDTNDGVEDVYQYEPEDIGSCRRQDGCISLISAGHEAVDSNFLAMDSTGKNAFFTTRDQLTQRDRDDLLDVYDAREGGGIAAETETARSECQGEACQGPVAVPNDPTPASSSFEGPGNVKETKAPKKHKKHKHAKKSQVRSHARIANHDRGGAK
jgi:hypothetical protein